MAFEQLSRDFALTHEQIAQKTGKDRASITNFLRLLKLAAEVQTMLAEGALTMGHAKALAGFDLVMQRALAHRIVDQGLECPRRREDRRRKRKSRPKPKPAPPPANPNTRAAIQRNGSRQRNPGVRVVESKRGAGRIEDRVLQRR